MACLIAFLVAPAYRRRLERLATTRIRRALPATEAEIRADKDRVRAESAVRVYALERQVEQSKLSSARQLINLSRRDARINETENEVRDLKATLEESQNARLVLEQTVTERLPKVEHRLAEAKKLLYQRDREIATLTSEAGKSARALEEAFQINVQSRAEIERLTSTLNARLANGHDGPSDPAADGDVALRTELEALRARNKDQAELIAKLQSSTREARDPAAESAALAAGNDGSTAARLTRELEIAEQSLRLLRDATSTGRADPSVVEQQARAFKTRVEDQASEIARLKATLATYEDGGAGAATSIKDSKLAMKARVSALQAQCDAQTETIQKLRAELAAANQKQARQAAQFVGEMRRIGAGQRPNGAQPRAVGDSRPRRGLADRLNEEPSEKPAKDAASAGPSEVAVSSGRDDQTTDEPAGGVAKNLRALSEAVGADPRNEPDAQPDATPASADARDQPAAPAPKGRLLDRLSSLGKA